MCLKGSEKKDDSIVQEDHALTCSSRKHPDSDNGGRGSMAQEN